MLRHLQAYRVILGSHSPRRRELLEGLGLTFEVRTMPEVDESYPHRLPMQEIPLYIARNKAGAFAPSPQGNELLITADTVVLIRQTLLGKPADRDEALGMLELLSGCTHRVLTGVCLVSQTRTVAFSACSLVRFAPISEADRLYYVDHFHPYDKAGGYGIQEWIGYIAVEAIHGSFYNVMGLPVERLYRELARFPHTP
ncbi:MAG: Maf family protein [Tannerellaceae bacterium]|jgi:septum formation protein|nr:Maf family protein [Tannerellaceae bacterium]